MKKKYLKNVTRDGTIETYENLQWHGGEGATLAMRLFTEKSMLQQLHRVGLNDVKYYRMFLKYGIYWPEAHHQILSARISASASHIHDSLLDRIRDLMNNIT